MMNWGIRGSELEQGHCLPPHYTTVTQDGSKFDHPTQKPLELIEILLIPMGLGGLAVPEGW